jgi:hypothetical protein
MRPRLVTRRCKEVAHALRAETADEQTFLFVAQQRLGPRGEAPVANLVLHALLIPGVDLEAECLIVAAARGSARIEANLGVRKLVGQRLNYRRPELVGVHPAS